MMKKLMIIMLGWLFLFGCTSYNRMMTTNDQNLISIEEEDDEEYELIVLDPGFETWFATTWSPAKDRSAQYYASWNRQYVTAWNYKATHPNTANFFDTIIQYDFSVDYGIELDRKLYYYFRWVDTKLGIPILDQPPPGGLL